MSQPGQRPILLVEDNEAHYEAMARALRLAGCNRPLVRCADGDEALDFLHRRGRFEDKRDSPRPGIILLDLNLPGICGQEVLAEIKADHDLKAIPVVVVSSLAEPAEVLRCYRSGANGFIRKRNTYQETVAAVRQLSDYWFSASEMPDGA
jgi:CheY-like chemotaxis protein